MLLGADVDLLTGLKDARDKAARLLKTVVFSHVEEAERISPLDFYRRGVPGKRFFWQDPTGELTLVGTGHAFVFRNGKGNVNRFKTMKAIWGFEQMQSGLIGRYGTGPICFGAFSFLERVAAWEAFGDYFFVVPELMLTQTRDGAFLTASMFVNAETTDEEMAAFVDRFENRGSILVRKLPRLVSAEVVHETEWQTHAAEAVAAIRAGELNKVVLARTLALQFDDHLSASAMLERMQEQTGPYGSYLFCLENGYQYFTGITPERLIKKMGQEVSTACVAGTTRRGKTEAEDLVLGEQLLQDKKNRAEHQFVVDVIRTGMAGLCQDLSIADTPELLKNKYIQHLFTSITGWCDANVSILDFVQELHPTPAMAGSPTLAAIEKILAYEDFRRGFYASPIGWMDLRGNGEFVVGIRSALMEGRKGTLFAGCGIVADSDPLQEVKETKLKFRPMLRALGIELDF